eukprot:13238019-Alexandrium_andersonii.AAC.1
MHGAWGPIYAGRGPVASTAAAFLDKYQGHIWRDEEFQVGPLTTQQVWQTFRAASPSSAGADGWLPMELKYMPRVAARYLCWMLRLIEDGAPWPAAILLT